MPPGPRFRSRKEDAARFAAKVASDPSAVVTFWKAISGGKAVACLPSPPVPEILHAAGLLALTAETVEELFRFHRVADALLIRDDFRDGFIRSAPCPRFLYPSPPAPDAEAALDRIEALSEWAADVSGTLVSEGSLWRSIRAHIERKALLSEWSRRCGGGRSFLPPETQRDVVRAGSFLPPETHSFLLSVLLDGFTDRSTSDPAPGRGDPFLYLARRMLED